MTRAGLARLALCALLAACGDGGGSDGRDAAPRDDAGPEDQCLPAGASLFVKSGDPAPYAEPNLVFGQLGVTPVAGPDGQVVFTAFVGTDVPGADRQSLWHFDGQTIQAVAVQGEPPTAADPPDFLALQGDQVISHDGRVGFQLVLPPTDLRQKVTFSWDPVSRNVQLLVAEGQPATEAGEPFQLLEPFTHRDPRSALDTRLVFYSFYTSVVSGPCPEIHGIWATAATGIEERQPVILRGAQAVGYPAGILYSVYEPEIQTNEAGRVAAIVSLMDDVCAAAGAAVYRWDLATGAGPELLATAYPPGTPFVNTSLRDVRMNAAGQVGWIGAGQDVPESIMVYMGPSIARIVAKVGDPIPDLLGATFARMNDFALLENGVVVFTAEIAGGDFDGKNGLWRAVEGVLEPELLLFEGMEPFELPGLTIRSIEQVHANDAGVMVIRAFLDGPSVNPGNDLAVFVWEDGIEALVLRTGAQPGCPWTLLGISLHSDLLPSQGVEVFGPGQGGTPRGIDADGRIPFHLRYGDEQGTHEALGVLDTGAP